MSFTYSYSKSSDFGGNFNPEQFQNEITGNVNIITNIDYISVYGDNISIIFVSELNNSELTELNNLVSNYIYGLNPRIELLSTGNYGSVATIEISQTANRTITLPDITDNILSENNVSSVSGKTLLSSNNTITKTYDAIIDASGKGDYTSVAQAFIDGKSSVLVRNGIYYESNNIEIPNNGRLVGEANGQVYIVMIGNNSLKCDPSLGNYENSGTISITKDTSNITGVGTFFTNLTVGDFILVANNFFKILSITDDTNLILEDTYRGNNISGNNYIAQKMFTGLSIENIIIAGSSNTGIFFRGVRHFTIKIQQFYLVLQILL